MNQWQYLDAKRQQIPANDDQFIELVQKKIIKKDTMVWKQGMSEWEKAEKVNAPAFAKDAGKKQAAAAAAPQRPTGPLNRPQGGPQNQPRPVAVAVQPVQGIVTQSLSSHPNAPRNTGTVVQPSQNPPNYGNYGPVSSYVAEPVAAPVRRDAVREVAAPISDNGFWFKIVAFCWFLATLPGIVVGVLWFMAGLQQGMKGLGIILISLFQFAFCILGCLASVQVWKASSLQSEARHSGNLDQLIQSQRHFGLAFKIWGILLLAGFAVALLVVVFVLAGLANQPMDILVKKR